MKKVLIAGHDGDELSGILSSLIRNQDVELLIISQRSSIHASEHVRWLYCDVFSLDDLARVMKGFDEVYFFEKLSALPLGLVQGKTEDIELLMITNFLEAAKISGIKKIFFLGKETSSIAHAFQKSSVPFELIDSQVGSKELEVVKKNDVRSIQKFVLPPPKNAQWVGEEYFKWLPRFFSNIIRVKYDGKECSFFLFNEMICLLKLRRSAALYSGRINFNVVGGLLNGKNSQGRLEFVETLDGQYIFGALHNFVPALPWPLYRFTQALVHVLVMGAFGEHLKWCYLLTEDKR